jgi:hypothetical protein
VVKVNYFSWLYFSYCLLLCYLVYEELQKFVDVFLNDRVTYISLFSARILLIISCSLYAKLLLLILNTEINGVK